MNSSCATFRIVAVVICLAGPPLSGCRATHEASVSADSAGLRQAMTRGQASVRRGLDASTMRAEREAHDRIASLIVQISALHRDIEREFFVVRDAVVVSSCEPADQIGQLQSELDAIVVSANYPDELHRSAIALFDAIDDACVQIGECEAVRGHPGCSAAVRTLLQVQLTYAFNLWSDDARTFAQTLRGQPGEVFRR